MDCILSLVNASKWVNDYCIVSSTCDSWNADVLLLSNVRNLVLEIWPLATKLDSFAPRPLARSHVMIVSGKRPNLAKLIADR